MITHNRIETVSSLLFKLTFLGNGKNRTAEVTFFLKLLNGNGTYLIKIIGT